MFALLLPLLVAFAGAALAGVLGRWRVVGRPVAGPLAVGAGSAVLVTLAWIARSREAGAQPSLRLDLPWSEAWGWHLSLGLDPLSALYALLAAAVAVPVLAYATAYLPHDLEESGRRPRGAREDAWRARREASFYAWMLLFLASMVGMALARDLVLLFVFFDLTAICSWALIGFDRTAEARRAALTSLLVTGVTSVALLVGILLLQVRFGTLDVAALAAAATSPSSVAADGMTQAAMLLVLLAALAKSAQVPLHFWLPRAMAAPTPVSAYLHSASMVAAGVFLLHRLQPLLAESAAMVLATAGWTSIVAGGLMALRARELKAILAYSTIAHYGHVAVILALGGRRGAAAAAVYVLVHGVAKSALFLTAGAVIRSTGADALDEDGRLVGKRGEPLSAGGGRLARRHPLLAGSAAVAAAALAGLPLTAGFFKDEGFFKVLEGTGPAAMAGGVLALGLTAAYMARFWIGVFLRRAPGRGPAPAAGTEPRERALPRRLVLPVAVLALALLAGGVGGGTLAEWGRGAAETLHGPAPAGPDFELAYHPDLRTTHLLALGGWGLALLLIASRRTWAGGLDALIHAAARVGPARLWDGGREGLNRLADRLHLFEIRDLRDRIASVLLPAGVLVLAAVWAGRTALRFELGAPLTGQVPLALALLAAGTAAVATIVVRSHLGMVLLLTGVGFAVAVVFALLGGPDVALVAVLVETALTLLFVVVLGRLPGPARQREERRGRPEPRSPWHAAAALTGGGLAFAAAWTGLSHPARDTVALRHLELTDAAHAKNTVAAILADFRALDTLGEVTVLAVALLGILALIPPRGLR